MKPPKPPDHPLADRQIDARFALPATIGRGYFDYERYRVTVEEPGSPPRILTRDILRGGRVAAVLPFDPGRGEIVLLRQFRLPAHLALGLGEMIEIVAGRVEPNEDIAEAARRECVEEIGVEPRALQELITYLPTPGITDETITLFLAIVDASDLPTRAGAADEQEETRPVQVSIDAALAALEAKHVHNGNLILALQWLALNRPRLDGFVTATAR